MAESPPGNYGNQQHGGTSLSHFDNRSPGGMSYQTQNFQHGNLNSNLAGQGQSRPISQNSPDGHQPAAYSTNTASSVAALDQRIGAMLGQGESQPASANPRDDLHQAIAEITAWRNSNQPSVPSAAMAVDGPQIPQDRHHAPAPQNISQSPNFMPQDPNYGHQPAASFQPPPTPFDMAPSPADVDFSPYATDGSTGQFTQSNADYPPPPPIDDGSLLREFTNLRAELRERIGGLDARSFQSVVERIQQIAEQLNQGGASGLREDIAGLRKYVADSVQPELLGRLEKHHRLLLKRLDDVARSTSGSSGNWEARFSEIEARFEGLARSQDLEIINKTLAESGHQAPDPAFFERLDEGLKQIRGHLEESKNNPPLHQVQEINKAAEHINGLVENILSDENLPALEGRLDELLGKLDKVGARGIDNADIARLQGEVAEIRQLITQTPANLASELKAMMAALVKRVDALAGKQDADALGRIEAQIGTLNERIKHAEHKLSGQESPKSPPVNKEKAAEGVAANTGESQPKSQEAKSSVEATDQAANAKKTAQPDAAHVEDAKQKPDAPAVERAEATDEAAQNSSVPEADTSHTSLADLATSIEKPATSGEAEGDAAAKQKFDARDEVYRIHEEITGQPHPNRGNDGQQASNPPSQPAADNVPPESQAQPAQSQSGKTAPAQENPGPQQTAASEENASQQVASQPQPNSPPQSSDAAQADQVKETAGSTPQPAEPMVPLTGQPEPPLAESMAYQSAGTTTAPYTPSSGPSAENYPTSLSNLPSDGQTLLEPGSGRPGSDTSGSGLGQLKTSRQIANHLQERVEAHQRQGQTASLIAVARDQTINRNESKQAANQSASSTSSPLRRILIAALVIVTALFSGLYAAKYWDVNMMMSLASMHQPQASNAPAPEDTVKAVPTPKKPSEKTAAGETTVAAKTKEAASSIKTVPAETQTEVPSAANINGQPKREERVQAAPSLRAELDADKRVKNENVADQGLSFSANPAAFGPDQVLTFPKEIKDKKLAAKVGRGQPEAHFIVGTYFLEGRYVKKDLRRAAAWYSAAAKAGHAPAQFRLGSLYDKGHGVTKDANMARALYFRASELGNVEAMHNLAVLHSSNAIGQPNFASAVKYFEMAANHGLRDSQYNLGILYARGLGIPTDYEQSYFWFTLAAKQGDKDADIKRQEVAKAIDVDRQKQIQDRAAQWRPKPAEQRANTVPGASDGRAGLYIPAGTETRESILLAQTLLVKLGYNIGQPDGIAGRKTRSAIVDFQRKQGIKADGKIDGRLINLMQQKS